MKQENIIVCDQHGVLRVGREKPMDKYKTQYAKETDLKTLKEAIVGADAFLGLSVPGVIDQNDVKKMADRSWSFLHWQIQRQSSCQSLSKRFAPMP